MNSSPEIASHNFDHKELLGFKHPHKDLLTAMIPSQETRLAKQKAAALYKFLVEKDGMGTEFSSAWWEELFTNDLYKSDIAILENKLSGTPLIDLGGGVKNFTNMQQFAAKMGASAYINVDCFLDSSCESDPYRVMNDPKAQALTPSMPIALVPSDMLEFLSLLQSNSVNITLNGIDYAMIGDETYHYILAQEIVRVTRKGGICFGTGSEALKHLSASGLEPLDMECTDNNESWCRNIFQKQDVKQLTNTEVSIQGISNETQARLIQ